MECVCGGRGGGGGCSAQRPRLGLHPATLWLPMSWDKGAAGKQEEGNSRGAQPVAPVQVGHGLDGGHVVGMARQLPGRRGTGDHPWEAGRGLLPGAAKECGLAGGPLSAQRVCACVCTRALNFAPRLCL